MPVSDPNAQAWLYLAMDIRHPERTKLGMTCGDQYSRTGRQTANPGMLPLVHIAVPAGEVRQIEGYLPARSGYEIEVHATTGRPSEWVICTPKQLAHSIRDSLPRCIGGLWNDDGELDFSAIVEFPDRERILDVARNLQQSEMDRYFDALNDVRVAFGYSPLSYEALFGWFRGQTMIIGGNRR